MAPEPKEPARRPGGAARASETTRTESGPGPKRSAGDGRSAAATDAPAAPRAHRTGAQRALIALGSLATVLVLLSACTMGYFNWKLGQITRVDLNLTKAASGGPQNYLIVGSDSRAGISKDSPNAGAFLNDTQYATNAGGAGQRSDSIMILRVDPSKTSAQVLSLPRDLYVPISGTDHSDRINAAFGLGQKTLIQTIEDQFGIVVNHYAEVDFVGFQRLVDAIGGVTMYFDKPMWDGNTGFYIPSVGCHTLNGTQALNFARARHLWYLADGQTSTTADPTSLHYATINQQLSSMGWSYDGTSDLGRISRQQLLIRTAIPIAEHKAFRNPATLNAIANSVVDSVTLDKGLTTSDLIGLAKRFRSFSPDSLVSYAYPTTPETLPSGEQILRPDEAAAEKVLAKFRDQSGTPESQVSVKVLNGSGVSHQAANVGGALQRVGFGIDSMADASAIGLDQVERTQVRYAKGDLAAAKLVASHLTAPVTLMVDPNVTAGTVEVVTGTSFTTVSTTPRSLQADELPQTAATTTAPTKASTTTSSTVVGVTPKQVDKHC